MCFGGSAPSHGNDVPLRPVPAAAGQAALQRRGPRSAAPSAVPGPSRAGPPVISHAAMSSQTVGEAVQTIAYNLRELDYVLIGGIALNLLGSRRATADIDVLVPRGYAGQVATVLGQTGSFGTESLRSGRSRVWFNARNRRHYNVDIMEPGDIHQTYPNLPSGTLTINSTRILAPRPAAELQVFLLDLAAGTTKAT
jgi:hypothetical protein